MAVVPGAPTSVVAQRIASGQLRVSFLPPASNGGSAITKYTVTCTSSNGGLTGSAYGTASPLTVSALTAGRSYTCKVTATNAKGTSLPSTPSAAVVA